MRHKVLFIITKTIKPFCLSRRDSKMKFNFWEESIPAISGGHTKTSGITLLLSKRSTEYKKVII